MYELLVSSQFKKDIKSYKHLPKEVATIQDVIDLIRSGQMLPWVYRDHELKGMFSGVRECHVFPNILLIYEIDKKKKHIRLVRIGSHSELFG